MFFGLWKRQVFLKLHVFYFARYNRALHWIENASLQDDEEEEAMKKVRERTLRNLLICYNKIHKPKLVCVAFAKIEKPNAKAMFK